MIRILVVDDHMLIREGLRRLIAKENDMRVEGDAEDGKQALALIGEQTFDVIILDIALPGMNGLELLKQIKSVQCDTKVLMLTMHPEDRFAMYSLKQGADGYLIKTCAAEELVSAIRRVARGERYLNQAFAKKLSAGSAIE